MTNRIEAKDIHAMNVVSGIQQTINLIFQQPFKPPPNLHNLRQTYLKYLQNTYRYLDMKGIMQVQQVTQQLPLSAVYVPLKATASFNHKEHRIAGRQWSTTEMDLINKEALETIAGNAGDTGPQTGLIEQALQKNPAMIVLGDPGAGKSTVLKILSLALAQQEQGPLPIILPLNAYARYLEQNQGNLLRCLSHYYASRQDNLAQISHLFKEALEAGQAVVLLDGLDEVQAKRPYLVRLVQEFVNRYIPIAEPTETTVVGNRIIITSRIVGYKEAPLAGKIWQLYTLTDFTREDRTICKTMEFGIYPINPRAK